MASAKSSTLLLSRPAQRPGIRRLSSINATENEVTTGGPVVVVPERLMHRRSKTHHGSFAASMETARNELAATNLEEDAVSTCSSSSAATPGTPGSPMTPLELPTVDSFAFAFDIDGVLIRGGRPIPEAVEALKMLNGENEYGIRVYDESVANYSLANIPKSLYLSYKWWWQD